MWPRGVVGVRWCWSSGPRDLSSWRQRFLRLRRCQSLRRARSNIAEARLVLGAADRVLVRRYGFPVKCHMGRLVGRTEERKMSNISPIHMDLQSLLTSADDAGRVPMCFLNRHVVEVMRSNLQAQTATCVMNSFGISVNTWTKLRDGKPIRRSVAERSSEERRVGNECVSTWRYRWWPDH